jgi:photosystem II stability/assembly factor-like uncharacterized protein
MGVSGATLPQSNWIVGAANPNVFMLSGGDSSPDGNVYTSPTGLDGTWAIAGYLGYPGVADACGWDTNFVIVGPGFGVVPASSYSNDNGATWANGDLESATVTWEGVAAKEDGSIIVAVGNDGADGCTARSLDGGATWSAVATPFGAGIFVTKIAWNGSVFCAVAFSGEVYTSSDGSSWSLQDTLAANLLWDIVARLSDGIMVIVGDDGGPAIYASSDDGATWTEATTYPSGFTNQIVRVAGCDSGFVVIEDGGNAYSSSADGLTWAAPVACPDNPGGATFFDDAEASRADSCVRATKFADYAFIFAGDDATAVSTPFFHFSF